MVESRGPNNEQHQGVSMAMGLIWVQETLLGPSAVGGARSPSAQGVPRGCSGLPPKGWGPQHPHSVGSQPRFRTSCYSIPPGMLHAALASAHQSSRVSSEQGGRWGVLALHPSSCLMHPAKEGRDGDKPRKGTMDEGARVAAETEPLKPAETQHSCNTANTPPLTTDFSQTRGLQGRRGALGKRFTSVCKRCQCFLTDRHSKNPPTRNPATMVASSGDALPRDQNLIFRG